MKLWKWLGGKKTYLAATIKLLIGLAIAVLCEEPVLRVVGIAICVQSLEAMGLRDGIATERVSTEQLVEAVAAALEKRIHPKP